MFIFYSHKKLHNGEKILDIIDGCEDTKGNPGDPGRVIVTNMRIIWYSLSNFKFTLCENINVQIKKGKTRDFVCFEFDYEIKFY